MAKKQMRDEKILRHGYQLQRIFPASKDDGTRLGRSAVMLYKAVHRLEMEAHRLAERECNEPLPEGYSEKKTTSILKRLDALLGFKAAGVPVFLNGDPRGCALKIEDAYVKANNMPKIDLTEDEYETVLDALERRYRDMYDARNKLKLEREALDPDEVLKDPGMLVAIDRMREALKAGARKVEKLADRLGEICDDHEPDYGPPSRGDREDFHSDG